MKKYSEHLTEIDSAYLYFYGCSRNSRFRENIYLNCPPVLGDISSVLEPYISLSEVIETYLFIQDNPNDINLTLNSIKYNRKLKINKKSFLDDFLENMQESFYETIVNNDLYKLTEIDIIHTYYCTDYHKIGLINKILLNSKDEKEYLRQYKQEISILSANNYLRFLLEYLKVDMQYCAKEKEKLEARFGEPMLQAICYISMQEISKFLRHDEMIETKKESIDEVTLRDWHCNVIYDFQIFFGMNQYDEIDKTREGIQTTPAKIIRSYFRRYPQIKDQLIEI